PPPAATETTATRKAAPARATGPPLVAATGAGAARAGAGRVARAVADRRGVKAIGPAGRPGTSAASDTSAASSRPTWPSISATRRRASFTTATAASVSRAYGPILVYRA